MFRLRGKLILTYTLVTVLALLALEVIAILFGVLIFSVTRSDQADYVSDVITTLAPQARVLLEPGRENREGLQHWLETVAGTGYASIEPQGVLDSPAAPIVREDSFYILAPDKTVLAGTPNAETTQGQAVLNRVLTGTTVRASLYETLPNGNLRVAVPVTSVPGGEDLLGVIMLTVAPPPPFILAVLPTIIWAVVITAVVLLLLVAPFGALFGFIMSRGLTRRLDTLTAAVDAWSEGDFSVTPQDNSHDEISYLGKRMRNMADRIQSLLHTQQELAMMEERNRLARELHDTIKQQNFATLMELRAARNRLESDPAFAGKHLEQAEGLVKTSQQELALMITELRPAALNGQGLAKALEIYLATWSEQTHIAATFQAVNERRPDASLEQALYRVAQEALANVARHSQATQVTLRLEFSTDRVTLTITDNGVGFDPAASDGAGFGLQSMRERMTALGGTFEVNSVPDKGTTVAAMVQT